MLSILNERNYTLFYILNINMNSIIKQCIKQCITIKKGDMLYDYGKLIDFKNT